MPKPRVFPTALLTNAVERTCDAGWEGNFVAGIDVPKGNVPTFQHVPK
jgi:hypothetical protein